MEGRVFSNFLNASSTKGRGRGEYNHLYIILGHHFDTVKKGVLFLLVFSENGDGNKGNKIIVFSTYSKVKVERGNRNNFSIIAGQHNVYYLWC